MSNRTGKVVVIGSGVIGTACAYYLSKAGWTVTIIDRGDFGRECSHANCGFVSPSHVLPLTVPGAVGKALRSMLDDASPFYVKPRWSWSLWSWLYRFSRRCNTTDMLAAARAITALLKSARTQYDQLFADEPIDCEWETRGLLLVHQTPAAMEHFAATDQLLREQFDTPAQRIDGDALPDFEPALKPGLAGAWFYPQDAHLRPDKLLSGWRNVLERRGVKVQTQCELRAFRNTGAAAQAALTTHGEIPADAFVVATGACTPLLNHHLGCRIPIQPGKGYSITMPRPARCPIYPLIFEEHRVAVTPLQSAYRLGSTMEFAGYDTTLNPRRLALLRAGAQHYLHEPFCEPVVEEWYGWRPMTYDSLPIIDRSPALRNVYIAAGHNMLGMSLAPATGRLITEFLCGAPPHVDPTPYSVRRF